MIVLAVAAGCSGPVHVGDATPEAPGLPTSIAISAGDAWVAYPDIAVDGAGTVWVSWVTVDGDDNGDVHLAWSTDGGVTFPAATVVDDLDQLFLGSVRRPTLAVSDDRIAVAVQGGSYLDSSVVVYEAPLADPHAMTAHRIDAAAFSIDAPAKGITLTDQPAIVFTPDGELVVTWKRGTRDEAFGFMLARESQAFAVEALDDASKGQPCECCPVDLELLPDGRALLAYRNNVNNVRDIYVAEAPTGLTFVNGYQASRTGWDIGGCPFDGPALATTDGGFVLAWVDGHEDDNYAYVATSPDGLTWSDERRLYPGDPSSFTRPVSVSDDDGTVWIAVEDIYHDTRLARTADGGATFEPVALDGEALFDARVALRDGVPLLVGSTEMGPSPAAEVWLVAPATAQ